MFAEESKRQVKQESYCCLSILILMCKTLFLRSSKPFWHQKRFHKEMRNLRGQAYYWLAERSGYILCTHSTDGSGTDQRSFIHLVYFKSEVHTWVSTFRSVSFLVVPHYEVPF